MTRKSGLAHLGTNRHIKSMRAVVGVDLEGHYISAANLLSRLDFCGCKNYMVHVLKPKSEMLPSRLIKDALDEFSEVIEVDGEIPPSPMISDTTLIVREGAPAEELLKVADSTGSDLICATATHQGALSCFTLGSVCRALAIGAKQSILIARGNPNPTGPIKAVFATDHSPYAKRTAERLLKMAPCGLGDVTVLSVLPPDNFYPISPEAAEAMLDQERVELADVQAKSENLARTFEIFGATSRAVVRRGFAIEEIAITMAQTKADLLIVGAQGHGFFDRVLLGSVSLHEVVSESYPVLVLRA
jgi:nucleotide-binding universal stress UspA family protein